jgi:hypothetical protein
LNLDCRDATTRFIDLGPTCASTASLAVAISACRSRMAASRPATSASFRAGWSSPRPRVSSHPRTRRSKYLRVPRPAVPPERARPPLRGGRARGFCLWDELSGRPSRPIGGLSIIEGRGYCQEAALNRNCHEHLNRFGLSGGAVRRKRCDSPRDHRRQYSGAMAAASLFPHLGIAERNSLARSCSCSAIRSADLASSAAPE